MERNKNIDIVRAIAVLIIVIYHIFAISQVPLIKGELGTFVEYGGEYGVVLFFIISGFSIYKSLNRRKDNFNYGTFIKDRLRRILPGYYISLGLLICFTGRGALVLSDKLNLFSHAFLFHGLYRGIQGSISGVAWTLTPIFFFYLISPLLYKAIEKKPKLTLVFSIIISCLFKFIAYKLLSISIEDVGAAGYFTIGKSIFGVLDQFVIGMFLAKYIKTPKDNKKIILNFLIIILSLVALYFWIYVDRNGINIITENTNRYSNCFEAYIWYSVLTIILAIGIYGFSQIKINHENIISKSLLFVCKHEYGIYLWHLEFIRNVCEANPYIQECMTLNRRIVYVYLLAGSLFIGILMSIIIDGLDWKKLYAENKNGIKIFAYGVFILIAITLFRKNIMLIPETVKNINTIKSGEISFITDSKIIADNSIDKIPEDKKYAYIDNLEKGYKNFWEIRYFLAPRETEHIVSYVDILNNGSIDQIFEVLKNMDVDYFIIRDCKSLEAEKIIEPDEEKGTVYVKNKEANSIEELFEKVD